MVNPPDHVDLFDNIYSHFTERVLESIRKDTFGEDIGQNSWVTAGEYRQFISWLQVASDDHVLEVASGSGGPAIYMAGHSGCRVTGVDVNEHGIATAIESAEKSKVLDRVSFRLVDANAPLPFADNTFDGIICIDSMNHFADRLNVFKEWNRVLRPGKRAVFTDPVVITGPVTNDELAKRSSVGLFLFVPLGVNECLITEAGFRLVQQQDASDNAAMVSGRWHEARQKHKEDLLKIEGEERFEGLQTFFETVQRLTSERRLSRIAYVAEKRDT